MPMVFPTSPTVGQVFTSGGRSWVWTGSTWDSPRSDNPTIVSGLQQVLYYTSSGTFTKASYPWLRAIKAKVQAAGGGGGGAGATGPSTFTSAGGGGGGGYAEIFTTNIAGLASSVNVVVGAGGAGGVGLAGGSNGGGSTFTTACQAAGGGGGAGGGPQTFWIPSDGGPGGSGNGDVVIPGGDGSLSNPVNTNGGYGGVGGSSVFAGQLRETASWQSSSNGRAGKNFGGGGGGASSGVSATAKNGGTGGNGIVILELYA